MLNFVAEQVSDNLVVISFAISTTILGITYVMFKSLHHMDGVIVGRQIDTTRVNEGLPTDITLTPEDFRAHPELAEIFEVEDTENNLDLILESQEHLEMLESQHADITINNLMALFDAIEAFIINLF